MKTRFNTFKLNSYTNYRVLFLHKKTTVTAKNSDISDNRDYEQLQTVLECKRFGRFERRLNDPKTQISNSRL